MKKKYKFLSFLLALLLLLPLAVQSVAADSEEQSEELPDSWFDDALFIGDSLTGSLTTYNLMYGGLGNAKLIHVNGLACHNIIRKQQQVIYAGQAYRIEDAVAVSGAGKLYLMLAMNDIGTAINILEDSWEKVLERIQEKNPTVQIYIQSGTPMRSDFAYFTKENMDEYNELLKRICEKYNCTYVDVTDGLLDENGYMREELRQDNVHMNTEGCAIWMQNLHRIACYSPSPLEERGEKP